jgi:hypothetical protein
VFFDTVSLTEQYKYLDGPEDGQKLSRHSWNSGLLLIKKTGAVDGIIEFVMKSASVIKTYTNLAFDIHKTEVLSNFHT